MRRFLLCLALLCSAPVLADSVSSSGGGGVTNNSIASSQAGAVNALVMSYYPPIDANDMIVYQFNDPVGNGTVYIDGTALSGTSTNLGSLGSTYVGKFIDTAGSDVLQVQPQNIPWQGGRAANLQGQLGSVVPYGGVTVCSTLGGLAAGCPTTVGGWTSNASWSMSMWVWVPQTAGNTYGASLLLSAAGGSLASWGYSGAGVVSLTLSPGGGAYTCNSSTVTSLVSGSYGWHHFGFSASNGAAAKIYVDGQLVSACTTMAASNLTWGTAGNAVAAQGLFTVARGVNNTGAALFADYRFANVVRPASYFQQMYAGYVQLTGSAISLNNNSSYSPSAGLPLYITPPYMNLATTGFLGSTDNNSSLLQNGGGQGWRMGAQRFTQASNGVTDCAAANLAPPGGNFPDSRVYTCSTVQTLTLPSARGVAPGVVQLMPGVKVNDTFQFTMASNAANNFTLVAGTGWTIYGNAVVNNSSKVWTCVITNVTLNSEAITCY